MSTGLMDRLDGLAAAFSVLYFCLHTQSFHYTHSVTSHTYVLLNSSNKRACSNILNVTLVSSTHNNGQKLQENVKSDARKSLLRVHVKPLTYHASHSISIERNSATLSANIRDHLRRFCRTQLSLDRDIGVSVCLSVRPSVCLSHARIDSKLVTVQWRRFYHRVVEGLYSLIPTFIP